MNRILLLLLVFFLGFSNAYAQKNLNDYKYVIVPNRYDFFDEADKYRLNALTKFLLKKNGFEALMADQPYPEDLKNDGCLALRANVINQKGMLKTKLEVELRDCSNALIYKTKVGVSRVKEYKSAYKLALRDAFTSFNDINYKYNGKQSEVSDKKIVHKKMAVDIEPIKEIKEVKPVKEEKVIKNLAQERLNKKLAISDKPYGYENKVPNILYAQAIDGGFQVVDSAPKVVMILFNTGKQNTYIVKGQDAIVYQEDGFWYISERVGDSTKTEVLNIKF